MNALDDEKKFALFVLFILESLCELFDDVELLELADPSELFVLDVFELVELLLFDAVEFADEFCVQVRQLLRSGWTDPMYGKSAQTAAFVSVRQLPYPLIQQNTELVEDVPPLEEAEFDAFDPFEFELETEACDVTEILEDDVQSHGKRLHNPEDELLDERL